MQNGFQIGHPASNHRMHMAEPHQRVPGNSFGSGKNLGELLRTVIRIYVKFGTASVSWTLFIRLSLIWGLFERWFIDTRLFLFSSIVGELYHVPDVRLGCGRLVSVVSQSSAGRCNCAPCCCYSLGLIVHYILLWMVRVMECNTLAIWESVCLKPAVTSHDPALHYTCWKVFVH